MENIVFQKEDLNYSSVFNLDYSPTEAGDYYFEIYLQDQIRDLTLLIGNSSLSKEGDDSDDQHTLNYGDAIFSAIPLVVVFIGVPGIVIGVSSHQLKKTKKTTK